MGSSSRAVSITLSSRSSRNDDCCDVSLLVDDRLLYDDRSAPSWSEGSVARNLSDARSDCRVSLFSLIPRAYSLNVCRIRPQARITGLAVLGHAPAAVMRRSCVSLTAAGLRRYGALSEDVGAAVPAVEISESSSSAAGNFRIASETSATRD